MKTLPVCLLLSVCTTACISDDGASDGDTLAISGGKADATAQVQIVAGQMKTLSFTAPAAPIDLTVVCDISANPDVVGTQFTVQSTALGLSTAGATNAAYWQWTGEATPGPATLKITGKGGSGTCTVRLRNATGSCTSSLAARRSETGHEHLRVGTIVPTWGDFPASGNHWGAWAHWDKVYTRPVKRGFYLHNLEHGGLVLSYKCSSPTESDECADAAANLEALKESFGERRVIVTPDPDQPELYAARGWRTAFASECFDEDRMLEFMANFFRQGREDIDADPPLPYDPTTLDVPCINIAAAPDSCR